MKKSSKDIDALSIIKAYIFKSYSIFMKIKDDQKINVIGIMTRIPYSRH